MQNTPYNPYIYIQDLNTLKISYLQREPESYWRVALLWQRGVQQSLMMWQLQLALHWSQTEPLPAVCLQTGYLPRSSRRRRRSSSVSYRPGSRRLDLCNVDETGRCWTEDDLGRSQEHWRWYAALLVPRAATAVHWIHTEWTSAPGCGLVPMTTPTPYTNGRLRPLHTHNAETT